jgi:hypothetical protein
MTHQTAALILTLLPFVGSIAVGVVSGRPPIRASEMAQAYGGEGDRLQNTGLPMEEAFDDGEEIVPMNCDICLG